MDTTFENMTLEAKIERMHGVICETVGRLVIADVDPESPEGHLRDNLILSSRVYIEQKERRRLDAVRHPVSFANEVAAGTEVESTAN